MFHLELKRHLSCIGAFLRFLSFTRSTARDYEGFLFICLIVTSSLREAFSPGQEEVCFNYTRLRFWIFSHNQIFTRVTACFIFYFF